MPDAFTATGGCHCGAVRFTVTTSTPRIIVCNCSICTKKGFEHLIVAGDELRVHRGMEALTEYRFNTHTARHLFCATCGMHPFYVPRSHPDGWSVNANCLDELAPVRALPRVDFDGRHWEHHIDEIRD